MPWHQVEREIGKQLLRQELRAILSKSHKTARENRQRRTREAKARKERGESKNQLTK
jgi:hypothetical protein